MNTDFFELVEIDSIETLEHKVNMIDISVEEDASFVLSNGIISHNSAKGGCVKVRNVMKHGFFPLRGCPKNTFGIKESEIIANKEFENVMTIIGLRFGMTDQEICNDLNYGKIGILCDQDIDGVGHLCPLIINFLSRWKPLFQQHRVYVVPSPLYIFYKNKDRKNEERFYCYTKAEYESALKSGKYKGQQVRYIKGLGTLRPPELKDVLNNEEKWQEIILDNDECLSTMFGDDVQARRKIMEI